MYIKAQDVHIYRIHNVDNVFDAWVRDQKYRAQLDDLVRSRGSEDLYFVIGRVTGRQLTAFLMEEGKEDRKIGAYETVIVFALHYMKVNVSQRRARFKFNGIV